MFKNNTYLTIGKLVKKFKKYFPELTPSKLRFLESKGLLKPNRAENNYRIFSKVDEKKIYKILKIQKDFYLPLEKIKEKITNEDTKEDFNIQELKYEKINMLEYEKIINNNKSTINEKGVNFEVKENSNLAELDNFKENIDVDACQDNNANKVIKVKPIEIKSKQEKIKNFKVDDLYSKLKINKEFLKELVDEGFISIKEGEDGINTIDDIDLEILKAANQLLKFGLFPKHLKIFENSAIRQSNLLKQIIYPIIFNKRKDAYKKAQKLLNNLENIFLKLQEILFKKENKKFLEQYKQ